MNLLDWIAVMVVISSMFYLTFILTLPEWLAGLRKGEMVALLPEMKGQRHPIWVQIAILMLGLVLCVPFFYYLWTPILYIPETAAQAFEIIGLIVYLTGFGFMFWARRTLGKHWGLSTSLQAKLHSDHELIQNGPYTLIRHPMYFGGWVFMVGLVLLYPKWAILILLLCMIASFSFRARREEAVLAERFGERWEEYKKKTRFIIPLLY